MPEKRQAGALGLMGAAEVLGAGIAALPAAALYGEFGATTTWVTVASASLVCLGIGALRIRGTEPVTRARPKTPHPPAPTI